jgi:hypothetical protein
VDVGILSAEGYRHLRVFDSAIPGTWPAWGGGPDGAVATLARSADDRFVARSAGMTFDVILIDRHDVDAAYRDLCSALIRTGERSVIVIDHPSIDAALRVTRWIEDYHPGLDFAMVPGERPWTLVWRASGSPGTTTQGARDPASEDEAIDRWLRARESSRGPGDGAEGSAQGDGLEAEGALAPLLRSRSHSIMMPDR